ncbi:MAG: trigger factor [Hyphomicrobium sp.]|jgi:trigger factor|nr:trigger factor [Hyphomicrobium sp.]
MQIIEANVDGLKRTLKVVVGAEEIGQRLASRIDQVKDNVQLKGFRKGKVPVAHIKKVYGRSLMTEVLQDTIRETSETAIRDRKERPAQMPNISLSEDQAEINEVIEGKKDLAYQMTFEVVPEIVLAELSSIELERLAADVDDETLQKSIDDLLKRAGSFEADAERKAETGDRVTITYAGTIGGEPFEGGSGEGLSLVLGNAGFIPGFEEGIVGMGKGETKDVACRFPDDYSVETLAGKDAVFKVTVSEVEKPVEAKLDDDMAKAFGAENVDNLKDLVRKQIQSEFEKASRLKMKRELLDKLEGLHTFELPRSLVDREFEGIWRQVEARRKQEENSEDAGKSEDELRAEYQKIAERRVRLGLVVGEIGARNLVEVTQDEMRLALMEQARRYPGQEKFVYEYFEKTPGALQELRAPIFEDKVVDLVIGKARVTEKKVSREDLYDQVRAATEA